MSEAAPGDADWYADPWRRHERRYWDGAEWTEHVSSHGIQRADPPVDAVEPTGPAQGDERSGRLAVAGTGILDQSVLIVARLERSTDSDDEAGVYDAHGAQVAVVRRVDSSGRRRPSRLRTGLSHFVAHRLELVDLEDDHVLTVTRPPRLVKSRMSIHDGAGVPVGEVIQDNVFGRVRFGLFAGGRRVGALHAENWRAGKFAVSDADGQPVADISGTWEGLAAAGFDEDDSYALEIQGPVPEPLRTVLVASALTIDTALKHDHRGLT